MNQKSEKKDFVFPNHWLEGIIDQIEQRNENIINLSTGKTPSGHIHMGILREILICEAISRIFKAKGKEVHFRLFLDSLDAAKRFPNYIPKDIQDKYLGYPFSLIPDPFTESNDNYAEVFGKELIDTFTDLGIDVEPIWTHELYQTDEMKEMIRTGLKKNDEVKSIVAKYLTSSMNAEQKSQYIAQQENWMGAMVICEKCKRTQQKQKDDTIKPNRVLDYNAETDECRYICPACGYEGVVKVNSGLIKLNWRLDWPAKWTIFHTVCEPAGKDHCTPGGSYDTGLELCQKIYGYEGPVKVAYEWLRLGDRDMKTSKGIVFTPEKFLELAKPEIIRMLIYQTNPNKHISVRIEEMEQYYNEFHRLEQIYYDEIEATSIEEKEEINFIYPLICPNGAAKEKPIRLPFKLLTVLAQLEPILGEKGIYNRAIDYLKSEEKDPLEFSEFQNRVKLAKNWVEEMKLTLKNEKNPTILKKLSSKVVIFEILKELPNNIKSKLNDIQISALKAFYHAIKDESHLNNDKIRDIMMQIREKLNISATKIFQAFYLILLGEKRGPRLGPLMEMLEKSWIENRILEIIS